MEEWYTVEINGKILKGKKGKSILDTSLENGIYIPNLCSHPSIKPIGACRLCLVDVEGEENPVPSCTTKIKDGMRVFTESERVKALRRVAMELIMSEHPEDCSSCPKYGNCVLQSVFQYVEAGNGRFRSIEKPISPVKNNPLFIHDEYRCIKCGRCIRICRDVRKVGVLNYYKDNVGDIMVGTAGKLLKDIDCRFCGACAEVCPTGAIRDKEELIDKEKTRVRAYIPCKDSCPAHIDIPEVLRSIRNGDMSLAGRIIREKVVLPKTLGYICTHHCEDVCRRGFVNEPVSICRLKLAADTSLSWEKIVHKNEPVDVKVAVIGSGPAGLSAAFRLVQYGCSVYVYEKMSEAGGMLRYGIPEYRLPLNVLEEEIQKIEEFGVVIERNCKTVIPSDLLKEGYDAVVIAIGTHDGVVLPIPGSTLDGVVKNIDYLKSVRNKKPLHIAAPVVVLGGGSVAFDCALTAVKGGVDDVTIVCIEAMDEMRATKEEIDEALKSGIKIINKHTFLSINGQGKVSSLTVAPVLGFSTMEDKKMHVDYDETSSFLLNASTVIFAVGQRPEKSEEFKVELLSDSWIAVDKNNQTSIKGVFAAGDAVTGTRSVIDAIVSGKNVADSVAEYLDCPRLEEECSKCIHDAEIGKIDNFSSLCRPMLLGDSPLSDFQFEALRCLQCDLRLDIEPDRFWTDFKKGGV